jgi:hypothetical protein
MLDKGEVSFGIIHSTAIYGGYVMEISCMDEMGPFIDFFQKRFKK